MKILFLDSSAFAKKDMIDAFHSCYIETDFFIHSDYDLRQSDSYNSAFSELCFCFFF